MSIVAPPSSNGTVTNRVTEAAASPAVTPRKVALCGKAPSCLPQAPFGDPSWEIWGLADLYRSISRWDRWFEIHELNKGKQRWSKEYWQWLTIDHGKPLYIQAPHPEIPHGVVYPWAEVMRRFGGYFTNSVSWMAALYLLETIPEGGHVHGVGHQLGLYGIDMAQGPASPGDKNSEYGHQRPSCEYFVGLAQGLGVGVTIPRESELLKTRLLYGLQTEEVSFLYKCEVRRKELQQQLDECRRNKQVAHERELVLLGALDDLKWATQWGALGADVLPDHVQPPQQQRAA